MRSIGLSIEFAEHVVLVAPGVALVGAAIIYLIVEILGYPLAHTPTLGGVRWARWALIALFLLAGLVLLAGEVIVSAPVLFRALFRLLPFTAIGIVLAPLLVLCLLVMLSNALDEIRRALLWRRLRREHI